MWNEFIAVHLLKLIFIVEKKCEQTNVSLLKQNGKIFYIERPLSFLKSTPSRPLTSDYESLKKKYEERTPIYNDVCDIKIEAFETKSENVDLIIKKWEDNYL